MIFGNIKHDATITEIELSSVFFCATFANFLRGSMLSTKLSQTRVLHVVDLFVFCGILTSLLAWISVSVTVVIPSPQYSLSVKRSVERSSVCKLELSTTYALSRPRKKRFQIVFRELNWSLAILSLRSADVFPVVASLPPKNQTLFFGGREATTGNTSALRRLR